MAKDMTQARDARVLLSALGCAWAGVVWGLFWLLQAATVFSQVPAVVDPALQQVVNDVLPAKYASYGTAALLTLMVLGTVSSLIFNGNPLLRFDAYYVMSDLLGIPNMYTYLTYCYQVL